MVSMVDYGSSLVDPTKAEFGLVPKEMVPIIWPLVLPILEEKGAKWLETVSPEEVFSLLERGEADLWCGMQNQTLDGFVVAQWEFYSRARFYHIHYLAGKGLKKYMPKGLEQLEHYASLGGAKELVMDARPGVARLLTRHGYGRHTVRMKKDVRVLWRH